MPDQTWINRSLLALLLITLCLGLAFMARFSSGSSYPAYSSLSTAPAGSKILFEVLNRSGKLTAQRNYLPADQFQPSGASVFYLGLHPLSLTRKDEFYLKRFEKLAQRGNRVIIGLTNGYALFDFEFKTSFADSPDNEPKLWNVTRWDLQVRRKPTKNGNSTYSIEPGHAWTQESAPGIWERHFGFGSIVLLTDVNRLSNDKLAEDDSARALIPPLVGNSRRVLFDEAHLGVVESGSVMGLMRQYRLQGLLAGLLTGAALFIWKNAVRFPPPPETESESETIVAGSASQDMLAGLLEKHIAHGTLIEICTAEWNRVHPRKRIDASRWSAHDPVSAYRAIAQELRPKTSQNL